MIKRVCPSCGPMADSGPRVRGFLKKAETTEKILTFNGAAYTFQEAELYFDGNSYSDVFAGKKNKTLAQTISKKEYCHLERKARTRYSRFLDEELGSFLKRLKDDGDLFYTQFLNEYGDSVYSRFKINDAKPAAKKGLYIYCVKAALKYIGRSVVPFGKRINDGYGRISPKNCYVDGRTTNCHVNSLITKHKEHVHLLLLPLQSDGQIITLEKNLIREYSPEWNIQK
jgi:hypothetical protein